MAYEVNLTGEKAPLQPGPGVKPDLPQMDPGQRGYRYYTFKEGARVIGNVLVPNVSHASYASGTEYWFDVSTVQPSQSLTVTWADYDWAERMPSLGALSFKMNQAAAWASALGTLPAQGASNFVNNTINVVIGWVISKDASGVWTGHLSWFNTTGQNDIFRGAMPTGGVTLTANLACSTHGVTWYAANVGPI